MTSFMRSSRGAAVLAVFCGFLWGSAYPVLKICFDSLGITGEDVRMKMAFAGMRFFLASLLILAFYRLVLRGPLTMRKDIVWKSALVGLFQTTLLYYFFYNGLSRVSGMKSSILTSMGSFFLVILAHYLYKDDRMHRGKVAGLLAGFAGIVAVNWGGAFTWVFSWGGEGFLVMSAMVTAVGDLLAKRFSRGIHSFYLTFVQMLLGSFLLLIPSWGEAGRILAGLTSVTWALFLYSAVLSAAAFSIWFTLLKYHKAGEIALYRFVMPVAGTFLSALFLPEETLSVNILVGLVLVSAGLIRVNREGRIREKALLRTEI